jgi:tetratricopeptide (TPR) repeat protein
MILNICKPLFSVLVLLSIASAGDIDSLFRAGNKLYESEMYDDAVKNYEMIIQQRIHNASVYYNLGNCYYKKGQIGLAILNYEKAKRLSPLDEDVDINLRFAVRQTIDKQAEAEKGIMLRVLWKLINLFPMDRTTLLMSALYFLGLGLFTLRMFASIRLRQPLLALALTLLFVSLLLGSSLLYRIYSNETQRYGIVISQAVSVKNAPDGDQVLFKVHEGLKFRINKKHQGWCFVSLPNGNAGWIPETDLGEI